MNIFQDALIPGLELVEGGARQVKLAKLFDVAILFGAIQAREGTGGFELMSSAQLRALYLEKLAKVDLP